MRTHVSDTAIVADDHIDGMISFPAAGVFAGLGGVGVSMFFVT